MQEVFEKIIERLRESEYNHADYGKDMAIDTEKAVQIVEDACEEYNNGWISASECLPEESGDYTVTEEVRSMRTDNRILQTRVVGEVGFADGKWRRANHLKIIAWQPLPQPYEPKED